MWFSEDRGGSTKIGPEKTQQNVESEKIFTDAMQRVSAGLRTLALLVIWL